MHRPAAMAIACLLAACSNQTSKPADNVQTMVIADHFITCVGPHLETTISGSEHCPVGYRDGGVCTLPNNTREFVEDTQDAVDFCIKRGGKVE